MVLQPRAEEFRRPPPRPEEALSLPKGTGALSGPEGTNEMVVVLQALAHPLRLRLVATLCEREVEVNALVAALGVPQPIVSQQLRILRMARLVLVEREGGRARYRLARETLRELVQSVARCAEAHR